MIIPSLDLPFERKPFVSWLMIVFVIVVFILQAVEVRQDPRHTFETVNIGKFNPVNFCMYMWGHAGIWHCVAMVFFLVALGNGVCAKIGNFFYLPLYVLFGFVAAFVFSIFHDGGALGAAGAINGIAGMFLVFFPKSDFNIQMYSKYGQKIFDFNIPSFVMVILWIVIDMIFVFKGIGLVSYGAHIVTFVLGAAIATLLLMLNIIKTTDYERSLLEMLNIGTIGSGGGRSRGRTRQRGRRSAHVPDRDELPWDYEQEDEQDEDEDYEDEDYEDDGIDSPDYYQQDAPLPMPVVKEEDEYIRFSCDCGKKLKMPRKYAGKSGKCPKCTSRVRIPG